MFENVLGPYWFKRAVPDMERQLSHANTTVLNGLQDLWREVQSRCRRRDGSPLIRINCLITGLVLSFFEPRALNIRRQRRLSDPIDDAFDRFRRTEFDQANAMIPGAHDLGPQISTFKFNLGADLHTARGTRQRFPGVSFHGT